MNLQHGQSTIIKNIMVKNENILRSNWEFQIQTSPAFGSSDDTLWLD